MSTALQARLEAARTKKTVDAQIRRTNDLIVAVQPMLERTGDYTLVRHVIKSINDGVFSNEDEVIEFVRVYLS
jgi:hypothetical protein